MLPLFKTQGMNGALLTPLPQVGPIPGERPQPVSNQTADSSVESLPPPADGWRIDHHGIESRPRLLDAVEDPFDIPFMETWQ